MTTVDDSGDCGDLRPRVADDVMTGLVGPGDGVDDVDDVDAFEDVYLWWP